MRVASGHFGIYSKIARIEREERTDAQRAFYAILDFVGEVHNGGLEQYFRNGSGMDAPTIEACFRQVGAQNCAKLAKDAFEIVDGATIDWADRNARQRRILDISNAQWDQLAALDVILWGDPDPLEEMMTAFVEAHPADFTWTSDLVPGPRVRALRGSLSTGQLLEVIMAPGPNPEGSRTSSG